MCEICSLTNDNLKKGVPFNVNDAYQLTVSNLAEHSYNLTQSEKLKGKMLFYTKPCNDYSKISLFDVFINNIPEEYRQHYNCNTCHHFINKYGNIAYFDDDFNVRSIIWDENVADGIFVDVIKALRKKVETYVPYHVFEYDPSSDDVIDVCTSTIVLGKPVTPGEWNHIHAKINISNLSVNKIDRSHTKDWSADRFKVCINNISKYSQTSIIKALQIVATDKLHKTSKDIKCTFEALLSIKKDVESLSRNKRNRMFYYSFNSSLLYHLAGSIEGSLLDDIESGEYSIEEIIDRYNEKADPIRFRRPQSDPTSGLIKEAEKLVAELGIEKSLSRRYATVDDVTNYIWKSKPESSEPKKFRDGVFASVKAKDYDNTVEPLQVSGVKRITFRKFVNDVLPTANKIYFHKIVKGDYMAYVTATDPTAPPIIKWDSNDNRNPVSSYVYRNKSISYNWNIDGDKTEVLYILGSPKNNFKLELDGMDSIALFVLKDCKDYNNPGLALFPDNLIKELYPIRKVIESYSINNKLIVPDKQLLCGYQISTNYTNINVTVYTDLTVQIYNIDRWD